MTGREQTDTTKRRGKESVDESRDHRSQINAEKNKSGGKPASQKKFMNCAIQRQAC
jgi:hypothetical protein